VRTAVLHIGPKTNDGFPVELRVMSADATVLPAEPIATTTIPAAFFAADYAPKSEAGPPIGAKAAVELYAHDEEELSEYDALGLSLYRVLTSGGVGQSWHDFRDDAPGAGLCTVLNIASHASTKSLHDLPWEMMRDEDGNYLFVDPENPMLRGEALTLADRNPLVRPAARGLEYPLDDWPLRVIVAVSVEPGGKTAIAADEELCRLETLFGKHRCEIEYEVLENPTIAELTIRCADAAPHVLHFIGHADTGGGAGDSRLLMYSPRAPGRAGLEAWSARDIQNALQRVPIRLVVLNACRTAAAVKGGASALMPHTSLSDGFLRIGTLGVVGMQHDIRGDLAAAFSAALYEEIIQGACPDRAVAKARWEISRIASLEQRREWSFPVLRTRVLPRFVLPRPPAVQCSTLLVQRFSSRVTQRRIVRETLRGRASRLARNAVDGATGASSPHLTLITGESEIGKSHLAKWCYQVAQRHGANVVYVSFGTTGIPDLLDALRWIRDGKRPTADRELKRDPDWPLPEKAFREFTWTLNHRIRGVTLIPPLREEDVVTDEGRRLVGSERPAENFVDDTLLQFRLALENAARPGSLVLVLDQIEQIEPTALTDWLPRGLFAPIARGEVKGVHLVLITRSKDLAAQLANVAPNAPAKIPLNEFAPDEMIAVVRQLCFQWSGEVFSALDKGGIVQKMLDQFGHGGNVLQRIDTICGQMK